MVHDIFINWVRKSHLYRFWRFLNLLQNPSKWDLQDQFVKKLCAYKYNLYKSKSPLLFSRLLQPRTSYPMLSSSKSKQIKTGKTWKHPFLARIGIRFLFACWRILVSCLWFIYNRLRSLILPVFNFRHATDSADWWGQLVVQTDGTKLWRQLVTPIGGTD